MKIVKFFIPSIGTRIQLSKDWNFDLYRHPSNNKAGEALKLWQDDWSEYYLFGGRDNRWKHILARPTVPQGTIMKIKKFYLGPSWSKYPQSLLFYIAKGDCSADRRFEKTRFLGPLEDVNKIICEVLEGPTEGVSMDEVEIIDSRWDLIK